MPVDAALEALRTADRNTYETLLAARDAMAAYTRQPTAAHARKALEQIDVHRRAIEREREVLADRLLILERTAEGLRRFIERQGESPERPSLPPGTPIAFAGFERVPYPY